MRVVVAPDKFAGCMTASQMAAAFERGWRSVSPRDDVEQVPLSDGGPGFVDCLAASLAGRVRRVEVTGPMGTPVVARVFTADGCWYIEAAQANGLHLVPAPARDPLRATSAGVGELVSAAVGEGARRVVVGLGGSATNDGGAGMLGALGARAWDGSGHAVDLRSGPGVLAPVVGVALGPALRSTEGVDLVIATDVDNPLLGPFGASQMFGPQKGADESAVADLEASLTHWAGLCSAAGASESFVGAAGAGAAGGLGYGLLVLGGRRVSGIDLIVEAVGLADACRGADLVVTGEGRFDEQSLHGKVVTGVVAAAGTAPVVVVAGQSSLPAGEWRAAGIARVETLRERAASTGESIERGAQLVEQVAGELARHLTPGSRQDP